jgi:plastocyanin
MRRDRIGPTLGALLVALVPGAAGAAEVVAIRIEKLAFTPAEVSAHVGDAVEWRNDDFVTHTATARDGSWDVTIPPHESRRVVVKAEGKFEYFCKFHPNMVGRISVQR